MKKIYIIRHCEAEGQPPEASLTQAGFEQAKRLAELFSDKKIDRILSSPYTRAVQSIQPLASRLQMEIEEDSRLTERNLSTSNLSDWQEKLKLTFDELDLKFDGGESSREAMGRIVQVVEEVSQRDQKSAIIVSHGNLIALLLKHFDDTFGFNEWKNLSNPDVYLLTLNESSARLERLWYTSISKLL